MQIDSINELPEEKRPPEMMLWDESADEISKWIKKVLKGKVTKDVELIINDNEIEG